MIDLQKVVDLQKAIDAQVLAQAIINTIPEPFLVLDQRLEVLAASASFYRTFKVEPEDTIGRPVYSLGANQWDIPALRLLLETIIPGCSAMEGFEVEHHFPGLGRRTMLLNARQVVYDDNVTKRILLAFIDVTERRLIEREKAELLVKTTELLHQKSVLLDEMQHRVANSLQIIASILLLKAGAVSSEETRQHLKEAHQRVMSVAEIQRHLYISDGISQIDVDFYLSRLCSSLASSMVGENQPIAVKVNTDVGLIESDMAVSLGLIVTELVINSIKYAFPLVRDDAVISISYKISGADWTLIVSDNGVGKPTGVANAHRGLGTAIVAALVKTLDATLETASNAVGTKISISHWAFEPRLAQQA
jgi:two-component sensor histidine kinase